MCCFSRSCFIQTENNISYDNKQNKYMTISNTWSHAVRHVSPCALNVKAWALSHCILPDTATFSDPFPLTLQSSWERRVRKRRSTEGMGPGLMNTLSVRFVHVSNSILQKKPKKNWNVLVVYSCRPSATVAKSSSMYFFMCSFPVRWISLSILWWVGLSERVSFDDWHNMWAQHELSRGKQELSPVKPDVLVAPQTEY